MALQGESARDFPAVVIREFTPSDVPDIISIQEASAEASSWSHDGILQTARSGIAWVAEQGGVIGFLIGRGVADEFEILNLAVAKSHRRRGVATRLLETMFASLQSTEKRRVYLEVRSSNEAAIALYIRHGFCQNARRVRYYQNPVEDALIYSWDIHAAG